MFESTIICGQIYLGKQGEHHARRLSFNDVKIWKEIFGEGTCELIHQRNGDESPYPVILTIEDGVPYWYVSDVDTANAGEGKCELRYIINNRIVKSNIYSTLVKESLGEETLDIPEPQKAWVDQVIESGVIAKESAEQAVEAANNASVEKTNAEGFAIQSSEYAQTAEQSAKEAEEHARMSGAASSSALISAEEAAQHAQIVADNTQVVIEKANETTEKAAIVTEAVDGINSTFSNALKGIVSGVGAVRIDDISPIPHNIEISTDVDTTFKTCGKNIFDYKNSSWTKTGVYYYSYDIPNLTYITISCKVVEGSSPLLSVQKNNNGTWSRYGDFLAYNGTIKTVTINEPGEYRFAMRDTDPITANEGSLITQIQIEVGTQATPIEEHKEPTEGVNFENKGTTTLISDVPGANIEITYNRDVNKAFVELKQAIINLGGTI